MALQISTNPMPDGIRVDVCGEVDVSCADELRDVLTAALRSDVASVEVAIDELSYIDSTGIGVLVGAAHRAASDHTTFRVVNPQRNVARVLGMLGLERDLGLAGEQDGDED